MEISRRTFIKVATGSVIALTLMPRIALAAANSIIAVRTGIQPGNKTRIVIETAKKPSYSLSYPDGKLNITLHDTSGKPKPDLAAGTLVSSITQTQNGDTALISATLSKSINEIPKNQIMILEPGGNHKYRLVIDFAAGGGAAKATTTSAATSSGTTAKSTKKIIVIDAGHGGKDPGCIGRAKTREKDIVLQVAKKLRDNLKSNYQIYLTRDKDIFLNLNTRAGIAEKQHADLFVSLHANANPSRKTKGFSVYTLSKKASDAEAQKTAEAENASDLIGADGFEKFEPDIKHALSSMQQQVVAESSVGFGLDLVSATKSKGIKQQDNPLRSAPFAVLKSTIPSVLVELGHLSNAEEEKLLKSANHQTKLVDAIARAISKYEFLV